MEEIESFFKKVHGDFVRKVTPIQGACSYRISYSKSMEISFTIEVVILIPFVYLEDYKRYVPTKENCFFFFLYDMETDLIIGSIRRFLYEDKWKQKLHFFLSRKNEFLHDSFCPKCDFWLVERKNKNGQHFIGCSAYPECNYVRSK